MFIYFWEQVWTFGWSDSCKHNFITEEVRRCYCDAYHIEGKGWYYPTQYMEEGVDYLDY